MTNSQNTCDVSKDVYDDKILRSPFSCLETLMILLTNEIEIAYLLL